MMKKKIALLGNMNNIFFAICQYLIDYGYDAELFIFDYEAKILHFHPSADSYDDKWEMFTHTLPWGSPMTFLRTRKKTLINFFSEFDILIGCGNAPAFAQKAGRTLDIFAPYGADLNQIPYLEGLSARQIARYFDIGRSQREGIVNSKYVFSDKWPEKQEIKIEKLGLRTRSFVTIPFIYTPQYEGLKVDSGEPQIKKMLQIKKENDLIIFHHSRHSWCNPKDKISMKGNNILFEGVADFKKKYPKLRIAVVTFEYGNEVLKTKRLVKDLKIEDAIFWFPLCPRKEIMKMMSFADIVTGQFYRSFITYGTIIEGMAMSKPIMHRRDDMWYSKTHKELYPMIHVSSVQDVVTGLEKYFAQPEKYVKMGREANEWMQKYVIKQPLKKITEIINSS
ncbi:MAG: hypothetical protein OXH57_03865 [Ekhidna sp.]|nr:hypothetical protein [Ekhidna sp.]